VELRAAQPLGFSPEYSSAIEPFGQVIVPPFFEGSNFGRHQGLALARMPLSPSTQTLRASSMVAAMMAPRETPAIARSWHHSAPTRVLPQPRPQIASQIRHTPAGAS